MRANILIVLAVVILIIEGCGSVKPSFITDSQSQTPEKARLVPNLSYEESVTMAQRIAEEKGIDLEGFNDPEVILTWLVRYQCDTGDSDSYIEAVIEDKRLYSYALDSADCLRNYPVQFFLNDGSNIPRATNSMPQHTSEEIFYISIDLLTEAGIDLENHEFLGLELKWRIYFEGKSYGLGNHFAIVINDQTLESIFFGGR